MASGRWSGRTAQGRYGALSEQIVGDELHADDIPHDGLYLEGCWFQSRHATTGHHAASLVGKLGVVLVVVLVLVIPVAMMPRLLVAVGCSVFAGSHGMVGHGSRHSPRHGEASPTEEETEQHSR